MVKSSPPPLPSPSGDCVVIGEEVKNVMLNLFQHLRLVRDFARKRWPLRGSLQTSFINLPLWKREGVKKLRKMLTIHVTM